MSKFSQYSLIVVVSLRRVCMCVVTGLDQLLAENRLSDLALMYQLFSRVKDGLKELCTAFAAFIKVR
jgi:hypothetical protein